MVHDVHLPPGRRPLLGCVAAVELAGVDLAGLLVVEQQHLAEPPPGKRSGVCKWRGSWLRALGRQPWAANLAAILVPNTGRAGELNGTKMAARLIRPMEGIRPAVVKV